MELILLPGNCFLQTAPYNHPDIIRALFFAVNNIPGIKKKKTPEEKRQENIQNGRPANSGLPWDDGCRDFVKTAFKSGTPIENIASKLLRSHGSIIAELRRQELITPEEALSLQPSRK